MAIFKIYDCDFGVKVDGVDYQFTNIENFTMTDPEFNRLTRGANGQNKSGLVYKEGIKQPKELTVTIIDMSIALKAVLDSCYNDQTRLEAYAISRVDGSAKILRNAILIQQPQQKVLDESPESMNVELMFQSFDSIENHKS